MTTGQLNQLPLLHNHREVLQWFGNLSDSCPRFEREKEEEKDCMKAEVHVFECYFSPYRALWRISKQRGTNI